MSPDEQKDLRGGYQALATYLMNTAEEYQRRAHRAELKLAASGATPPLWLQLLVSLVPASAFVVWILARGGL